MTDPTLASKLEEAQREYQQLYSQYQQELLFMGNWQKRMKTENAKLTQQVADIRTNIDALVTHAIDTNAPTSTINGLQAARCAIYDILNGDTHV